MRNVRRLKRSIRTASLLLVLELRFTPPDEGPGSLGQPRSLAVSTFDDAQVRASYRRQGRVYLAMENDQGLTTIEVWRIQKQ